MSLKVLICDLEAERVQWVDQLLVKHYAIHATSIPDWEALNRNLNAKKDKIDLIILGPPDSGSSHPLWDRIILAMNAMNAAGLMGHVVVFLDNPSILTTDQRRRRGLHVLNQRTIGDWHVSEEEFIKVLKESFGGDPIPETRIEPMAGDPVLEEMIRSLGKDGTFTRGNFVLSLLARNLWACESVRISRLAQGLSGAKVFRADVAPPAEFPSFALKLCEEKDQWKIGNEITNWPKIEKSFDRYKLIRYVPKLAETKIPPSGYFVLEAGWYAVAYQLLGGVAGTFLSYEKAFCMSTPQLADCTKGTACAAHHERLAAFTLEEVLNCLKTAWHDHAIKSAATALWDPKDAQDRQVLTPPPYQFTSRQKANLLAALESFDSLGSRLNGGKWTDARTRVAAWVSSGPPDNSAVLSPALVLLSSVHGDLNSNNIMLWLDKAQPFLIDFAMFQEWGHTLQDFARLEVEIRYSLLDRNETGPDAFDVNPQGIPKWLKLDEELAGWRWKLPPDLKSASYPLEISLIGTIRRRAAEVWQQAFKEDPGVQFWIEYRAAMLYHTLRAVGYDSLSPFKRIVAVINAAGIMESLG